MTREPTNEMNLMLEHTHHENTCIAPSTSDHPLPQSLSSLFWDQGSIPVMCGADRHRILERVLATGNNELLGVLYAEYGKDAVVDWIRTHPSKVPRGLLTLYVYRFGLSKDLIPRGYQVDYAWTESESDPEHEYLLTLS